MRMIRVNYHYEPEGWTAESPDRDSWTAFGETLQEVRELAREGLPLVLDEPVELYERFPITGTFVVVPSFQFSGTDEPSLPRSSTAAKSDYQQVA